MTRRGDRPAFEGEELVVVASPMFPHRDRQGLRRTRSPRSSRRSTASRSGTSATWSRLLRDTKDKYITISFDDRASETIVFDRQEVLQATDEILTDNGVRQQASDDLLAVWKKK